MLVAALLAAAGCVTLTPYSVIRDRLPAAERLEIDGRTVHVVDRGRGPAVVLLHGFGASAWSWREVIPRITAFDGGDRFRAVAIDLAGFGWSERPRAPDAYTRDGQVATVLAVMDRLGIERAHLVGHSYGGAIAQALAFTHPQRLRSLVLVDTARPEYPRDRRKPWAALRPLDELLLRTVGLSRRALRRALQHSLADDRLVTPELVNAYRDRLAVEGAGRAYWGLTRPLPACRGRGTATGTAAAAGTAGDGGAGGQSCAAVDLAAIPVPTLVVWGEEDALIPVEPARRRAAAIPGARFVALPGVGHLAMEEAPDRLAEAILPFLAEVDGASAPSAGRPASGAAARPPGPGAPQPLRPLR